MSILNALKNTGGEFEINRVVGAIGGIAYIICANAYVAYNVMWLHQQFNVTEYCLAFPSGLGVIVASIAGAVSLKDRQVATAQVIRETGAVPAPPPAGPKVPVEDNTGELHPEEKLTP